MEHATDLGRALQAKLATDRAERQDGDATPQGVEELFSELESESILVDERQGKRLAALFNFVSRKEGACKCCAYREGQFLLNTACGVPPGYS